MVRLSENENDIHFLELTLRIGLLLMVLLSGFVLAPVEAKEYSIGLSSVAKLKEAEPIFAPEPEIPSHHKECAFHKECLARFVIDDKGVPVVTLLSATGEDEIDEIVLSTLSRWRFKPASLDGKPTPSARRIKIDLEIE